MDAAVPGECLRDLDPERQTEKRLEEDGMTDFASNSRTAAEELPLSQPDAMQERSGRKSTLRGIECMQIEKVLGKGTFGVVFRAIDITTPDRVVVALKKFIIEKTHKPHLPLTAAREIDLLTRLKHENVINLRELVYDASVDEAEEAKLIAHPDRTFADTVMVFEFAEYDLEKLVRSAQFRMSPSLIKSYIHQLLLGMQYLHESNVLHRDMKSANILITRGNVLKIADFGSSRFMPAPVRKLREVVTTLWYRSPELILANPFYGGEIDMWAVGCIFGELFARVALFPGSDETEQLRNILALTGSPTGALLDVYQSYPDFATIFPQMHFSAKLWTQLGAAFKDNAAEGLALLSGLLDLDPARRLTAAQALKHPFFTPAPPDHRILPALSLSFATKTEAEARKQDEYNQEQVRQQRARLQQLQQQAAAPVTSAAVAPVVRLAPGPGPTDPSLDRPVVASTYDQNKERRNREREQNARLSKFQVRKPNPAAGAAAAAAAPHPASEASADEAVAKRAKTS